MRDPVKQVLIALRALVVLTILILVALVSSARAFQEGDVYQGTFIGCDTLEDAQAYFHGVKKASDQASTCGTIRNAETVYIREVASATFEDRKITIHLVKVRIDGIPDQYVATSTKLTEM